MKIFLELTKINISLLVIVTCYIGYYLGLRTVGLKMVELQSIITFSFLISGTFFSSSGAGVLNQFIERKYDALMNRTKNRPIPSKKVSPQSALILGILFSILGPSILYIFVNSLTAIISLSTILIYLFIYTPSKRYTSFNTIIGSIPGALPPLGGWAAATGSLSLEAWMLFGILFCWQIPHFLSLAIIYKEDYKLGGFKMLPSISKNINVTSFQIIFFTMALIYSSSGIYVLNLTSLVYVVGAIILGVIFLLYSTTILFDSSEKSVKKIFIFSIIY